MKISGKLSSIIKGQIEPEHIIGKPISVQGGAIIGKIVEIDEENDLYFGEISNNVLINFCNPTKCTTCEIREE